MDRDEALQLVKEKIKTKNLIKHCLAVEACMRALAEKFGEDQEKWGLAGLLHDIDYEETKDNPEKHSLVGAGILEELALIKKSLKQLKLIMKGMALLRKLKWLKPYFALTP